MDRLIELVLSERLLVITLAVGLLLGGLFAFRRLNIEAYPDPSPPLVEVIAQQPGCSAEEMERQVTIPLETQLNGMSRSEERRVGKERRKRRAVDSGQKKEGSG